MLEITVDTLTRHVLENLKAAKRLPYRFYFVENKFKFSVSLLLCYEVAYIVTFRVLHWVPHL